MSTKNPEYFLFTSWHDFGDYGIRVHTGQSCPYKLRVRLILTAEGAECVEDFLTIPVDDESILMPADGWTTFAKWILTHVEKCKYVGVTPHGQVTGTDAPEQIEFIDAVWDGPFTFFPSY